TLSRLMADVIGGFEVAKIGNGTAFAQTGFASCFDCSDQDALNAAVQATSDVHYSILPRSAMGFDSGELILPHALGPAQPWRCRYIVEALGARPPTFADKTYWHYADGPIRHLSETNLALGRLTLGIASAIGRFYRRR